MAGGTSRKVQDLSSLTLPPGFAIPALDSDLLSVQSVVVQVAHVPGRHSLVATHAPVQFRLTFSMSFPAVPPGVVCLTPAFASSAGARGLPFNTKGQPTLPLFSAGRGGLGWSRLCTVTDLLFALALALEADEGCPVTVLQVRGAAASGPPPQSTAQNPAGAHCAGSCEKQGMRPSMEDVVLCSRGVGHLSRGFQPGDTFGLDALFSGGPSRAVTPGGTPASTTISGVFDGHGGRTAAEFCASYIEEHLARVDPTTLHTPSKLLELLPATDLAFMAFVSSRPAGAGSGGGGVGSAAFQLAGLGSATPSPSSPGGGSARGGFGDSASPGLPSFTRALTRSVARKENSGATACLVVHDPTPGGGAVADVEGLAGSLGLGGDGGSHLQVGRVIMPPAFPDAWTPPRGPAGSLTVAHVGDSRAVLSLLVPGQEGGLGSQVAVELTRDHKTSTRPDERARIMCSGGVVLQGRVQGRLAVTRALGDAGLKHSDSDDLLVTPTPELSVVALGREAEFVIVACDGVWDVLSNSDAVRIVRESLVQDLADGGDGEIAAENAAETLTAAALGKGSADNVSVVVKLLAGVHLSQGLRKGPPAMLSAEAIAACANGTGASSTRLSAPPQAAEVSQPAPQIVQTQSSAPSAGPAPSGDPTRKAASRRTTPMRAASAVISGAPFHRAPAQEGASTAASALLDAKTSWGAHDPAGVQSGPKTSDAPAVASGGAPEPQAAAAVDSAHDALSALLAGSAHTSSSSQRSGLGRPTAGRRAARRAHSPIQPQLSAASGLSMRSSASESILATVGASAGSGSTVGSGRRAGRRSARRRSTGKGADATPSTAASAAFEALSAPWAGSGGGHGRSRSTSAAVSRALAPSAGARATDAAAGKVRTSAMRVHRSGSGLAAAADTSGAGRGIKPPVSPVNVGGAATAGFGRRAGRSVAASAGMSVLGR